MMETHSVPIELSKIYNIPSKSLSSTRITYFDDTNSNNFYSLPSNNNETISANTIESFPVLSQHIPMFTSSCPGWICYAEKTHSHILPYISTVKSAQQILGSIIKKCICPIRKEDININSIQKKDIYHVMVMPCFDKKLEATRQVIIIALFIICS